LAAERQVVVEAAVIADTVRVVDMVDRPATVVIVVVIGLAVVIAVIRLAPEF
jgi:hypothetical protein